MSQQTQNVTGWFNLLFFYFHMNFKVQDKMGISGLPYITSTIYDKLTWSDQFKNIVVDNFTGQWWSQLNENKQAGMTHKIHMKSCLRLNQHLESLYLTSASDATVRKKQWLTWMYASCFRSTQAFDFYLVCSRRNFNPAPRVIIRRNVRLHSGNIGNAAAGTYFQP